MRNESVCTALRDHTLRDIYPTAWKVVDSKTTANTKVKEGDTGLKVKLHSGRELREDSHTDSTVQT